MCAIAALASKDGSDVSERVGLMLQTMEHRGRDWVRFSVGGQVGGGRSIGEVSWSGLRGSTMLAEAHVKKCSGESDPDYPKELFAAVDGRMYGLRSFERDLGFLFESNVSEAEVLAGIIVRNLASGLVGAVEKALSLVEGVYSAAIMQDGRMVFGRDPLGVKPLYFGESELLLGLASERKALWRVGIGETGSFPPGNIGELVSGGISFRPFAKIRRPEVEPLSLDDASARLESALRASLGRRLRSVGRVVLSFSGGVDSSVLARMISNSGCDVLLCVVGLEGCQDIAVAEDSAEELGLDIEVRSLRTDGIVDYVRRVVYAIEESDVMKVGVGLPLYAASETVGCKEVRLIFSGQGSDELFCGYNRYLAVLERLGHDGLGEEVWGDVLRMHEVNLQRDDAVTAANGVNLEVPFMDFDLVGAAMAFPVFLNVRSPHDPLRKWVLRRMAERLGLSRRIVNMPKKSAQYGSGVDRALRQIARTEGFRSVGEYLNSVFCEVFEWKFEGCSV